MNHKASFILGFGSTMSLTERYIPLMVAYPKHMRRIWQMPPEQWRWLGQGWSRRTLAYEIILHVRNRYYLREKSAHTQCILHILICSLYVCTHLCIFLCALVYRYMIICVYKGVCLLHMYVFSPLNLHISVFRFNHPWGKILQKKITIALTHT